LELMLREVADAHVLRLAPLARHDRLRSGQHLDERRLARAIGAEQADAIARYELEARVAEHGLLRVAGAHVTKGQQRPRNLRRIAKREAKRAVDVGRRDELHALQCLHAALRLARFRGVRLETVDVAANVRDLALLPHEVGLLPREARGALLL